MELDNCNQEGWSIRGSGFGSLCNPAEAVSVEAKRLGTETVDQARSISDKVTIKLAERPLRRRRAEANLVVGKDPQASQE